MIILYPKDIKSPIWHQFKSMTKWVLSPPPTTVPCTWTSIWYASYFSHCFWYSVFMRKLDTFTFLFSNSRQDSFTYLNSHRSVLMRVLLTFGLEECCQLRKSIIIQICPCIFVPPCSSMSDMGEGSAMGLSAFYDFFSYVALE